MLKRWQQYENNSSPIHSFLNSSNTIPRAYSLPKIYKTDFSLRIIVSSIDNPLHNLASFLHKILSQNL